jgi:hypothetical protein
MKALDPIALLLSILMVPLAYEQKAADKAAQTPVEVSVCKIGDNPSAYNNKLVKVRGYVSGSFECSILVDERCPESGI